MVPNVCSETRALARQVSRNFIIFFVFVNGYLHAHNAHLLAKRPNFNNTTSNAN